MAISDLGAFLRSRRGAVQPGDVGLPRAGVRRVSGLRREEVAHLAGVSVDYYIRLEQGRERNPSPQMLESLSTVLRLDDDGRAHLFRLARLAPRARTALGRESVDPGLLRLMNAWPDNPALVLGRAYDVLAANPIGEALFGGFSFSRNLMLVVFRDPQAQDFYADWPAVAANSVAGFRVQLGKAPDDSRGQAVLRELLERNPAFADLWERHDARGKTLEIKTFHHRDVGELTLRMQTFDVRGAAGQELVVYHAEDSRSANALTLLGTIAATESSLR
jgi:transcriptional regulator with XRE-family HTH domain